MSKQAASKDDDGASDTGLLARLQRELAERDRQLRDLAEQSLGFLEELAEARRLNGDRELLAERISELERTVADGRFRLQNAGGCAPSKRRSGKKGKQAPPLEVVFWGEGSLAAALANREACGDVPVTWVGLPADVPADVSPKAIATIVHRDAHTPAQCWNLGMAGTTADAVLFVGPHVQLTAPPALPDDVAPNTVLLCPRIDRDGAPEIGCVERDPLLHLVPRAQPDPMPGKPFPVPWAAVDAFVVRRAAFERAGTFDEALLGAASLLEYTLRARRANFEVHGVATPTLVAAAHDATDGAHDRERLFVLAMYRPDQVGRALADLTELWQLGTGQLSTYLAAILARLPAGDLAVQRAVLEQITTGLVQHALPQAQVCALVQSSRVALLRSCVDADLVNRDELDAALHRAERHLVAPVAAAFEALAHDISLCRNAATATARTLEQTRTERRQIDAERHAQSDRAERADGARAHVEKQLDQVQVWLREANAELKLVQERRGAAEQKLADVSQRSGEELRRLQAEREQLVQQLQAEREQSTLKLQAERERSTQQLQAEREQLTQQLQAARQANEQSAQHLQQVSGERQQLRDQVQQLTRERDEARLLAQKTDDRLAAQLQSHRELEQEFLSVDRSLRGMHEHTAELARIVGLASDSDRDGLQRRLTFLHEEAEKLATTLRTAGAPDERALLTNLDRLAQQLAATERTLREREQWIGVLLQEATSRRLFARPLQDHERAFLDRVGKQP